MRAPHLERGLGRHLRRDRRADEDRVLALHHRGRQALGIAPRSRRATRRSRTPSTASTSRSCAPAAPGTSPATTWLGAAVREVLVHLVGEVIHAALGAEGVHLGERAAREHGAARVVRRDRDDRARAIGERLPHGLGLQLIARVGRHRHGAAARHLDRHLVVEVERRRQDHVVARLGRGEQRVDERHVRPGRDHHAPAVRRRRCRFPRRSLRAMRARSDGRPAPSPYLVDLLAAHRLARRRHRLGRRTVVHHALAEGDGAGGLRGSARPITGMIGDCTASMRVRKSKRLGHGPPVVSQRTWVANRCRHVAWVIVSRCVASWPPCCLPRRPSSDCSAPPRPGRQPRCVLRLPHRIATTSSPAGIASSTT